MVRCFGFQAFKRLLMISISAIQPSYAGDASEVGLHRQHEGKQASKQASKHASKQICKHVSKSANNRVNNSDSNIRIAY